MGKKPLYNCIRCGYETRQKNMMRRHLYENKKTCPALLNYIEMTNDIKEYILANRIYHIPSSKPEIQTQYQPTINQTINHYHQINNVVSNMDVIDKINRYTEYKNIEIIDLEDRIEDQYHKQVKKLENGKVTDTFRLNYHNIIEVIDSVTCIKDIDTLNVLYDEVLNKLKLYFSGEWRNVLLEAGIKQIIEKIQVCYLDHYECILIRRYNDPSFQYQIKTQIKEHIEDYYKFLSIFDITPYVYQRTNNEILYSIEDPRYHNGDYNYKYNNTVNYKKFASTSETNDMKDRDFKHSIEDEWYPRYIAIKSKLSTSEVNKVKKEVHSIVKRNSRASVLDLNKKMMEIIQMDEEFKKSIIDNISCII